MIKIECVSTSQMEVTL